MAKKSKGLPFVVQPRLKPIIEVIGSEYSGQIEIERKGYLTVAEKTIVQSAQGDDNKMIDVFAAAREIAQAEGLTAAQVFEDLGKSDQPEYFNNHPETLNRILAGMVAHEERMKLIASTCLIMTRVNPDWDPQDTHTLHPDLQQALYDLYKDEEQRSVEALEAASTNASKTQEGATGKE